MGVTEEVSKTVASWTDALKREPLSLALVLMNLALLGFFYFILTAVAAQREREINLLYQDKSKIEDLLSKCVVPGKAELDNRAEIPLPKPRPHPPVVSEPLPDLALPPPN